MIGTIELEARDCFIWGRQPDVCDVPLDHPSTSRQHAVFQFRGDEALYVYDLGSAQGTFVNKTQIPAREHYELHVGDVVKFAASTRLYIICGPSDKMPPEYDSENIRVFRTKVVNHSQRIAQQIDEGATWGFREDAEEEEEDGEEDSASAKDSKLLPAYVRNDENYDRKYGTKYESRIKADDITNERDQALVEKIRKKELKIQNMQEEIRKIYLKENCQENGLTEGQLAAVARNDARIAVLMDEIEVIENQILMKQDSRLLSSVGGVKKVEKKTKSYEKDEDTMLDTTAETAYSSTNWRLKRKQAMKGSAMDVALTTKSHSHSELLKMREEEEFKAQKLRLEQARLQGILSSNQEKNMADNEAEEVERVLLQARSVECEERLKQVTDELVAVGRAIRSLDKLIRVSAPALASLAKNHLTDGTASKPNTGESAQVSDEAYFISVQETEPDQGSERKALEPIPTPTNLPVPKVVESTPKRHALQPVQGLAAFLPKGPEDPVSVPKKRRKVVGPLPMPSKTAISGNDNSLLEDGDAIWVPPAHQTGDGRTLLNDKYGY